MSANIVLCAIMATLFAAATYYIVCNVCPRFKWISSEHALLLDQINQLDPPAAGRYNE